MNKFYKRLQTITLSFGIIAACGLIYNLILFLYLQPRTLQFDLVPGQMDSFGILCGVSLVVIGIFHLLAVITLLLQIVKKKAGVFRILAIVLGILSGLLLLSDLSMLQDIGNEYVLGWDTSGEWTILFINSGLHILFTILALFILSKRERKSNELSEIVKKDDVLFITTHTTGLICGVIGLLFIAVILLLSLPRSVIEMISIPIGLMVLLPYLLIWSIWLVNKRKEKITEWLDEKQFQDIAKASMWTLVLTLICMVTMGILQRIYGSGSVWNFLWLPMYIFFSLIVFSTPIVFAQRQ